MILGVPPNRFYGFRIRAEDRVVCGSHSGQERCEVEPTLSQDGLRLKGSANRLGIKGPEVGAPQIQSIEESDNGFSLARANVFYGGLSAPSFDEFDKVFRA